MIKRIILPLLIILASCRGKEVSDVQVTAVKRGTFLEELTEQGTVKAVNSISISAPAISSRYGAMKLARIVEDGEEVEKGDTIMIFDPSEIKRAIIQAEQQLEIAKAEYVKLKSTQQSEIEDLEADLELAHISQEISKINFETAGYEPEATKKEIKLKLESATIALNRTQEQIENKKVIHREDLLQKSLTIKQLTSTLADANSSMNNLFVVSPAKGIAIKEMNWNTDQKWAAGDQPYSGSRLIELPDLSEMMAEVKINEVDVSKVLPAQKVEIRPDAYSDSVFTGKIESIANLAQNKDYKSKIKIFPVQIRIDGQSKTLLPGLTVSCKIIVSEIPDVLYVPLESLFNEQGMDYVYIKSGSGFKRRDIKTGAINTDYAIVTEGLDENDLIALSNPFLKKEEVMEKKTNGNNKTAVPR
ncbi:MAG: HlyD family efflux transporter periplasmic adaptor subunit [Bacteroidales bacterium]|nr:HlyD family efflux transporter periplasmic adaptor subunit [Bacteroidales bacterium]